MKFIFFSFRNKTQIGICKFRTKKSCIFVIDFYADDVSLVQIQVKNNTQILAFKNEAKNESVYIPVSNEKLLNSYLQPRANPLRDSGVNPYH